MKEGKQVVAIGRIGVKTQLKERLSQDLQTMN